MPPVTYTMRLLTACLLVVYCDAAVYESLMARAKAKLTEPDMDAEEDLRDTDELVDFDDSVCPSKMKEKAANLCVAKESGMSPEAMASLVWLNERGPDELPDADREHLCRSLTKPVTGSMKKCKELNGCNPKMFCTLQQYVNLRKIGCRTQEVSNLCESVLSTGHDELRKYGTIQW